MCRRRRKDTVDIDGPSGEGTSPWIEWMILFRRRNRQNIAPAGAERAGGEGERERDETEQRGENDGEPQRSDLIAWLLIWKLSPSAPTPWTFPPVGRCHDLYALRVPNQVEIRSKASLAQSAARVVLLSTAGSIGWLVG
jgi:hypothetical protein